MRQCGFPVFHMFSTMSNLGVAQYYQNFIEYILHTPGHSLTATIKNLFVGSSSSKNCPIFLNNEIEMFIARKNDIIAAPQRRHHGQNFLCSDIDKKPKSPAVIDLEKSASLAEMEEHAQIITRHCKPGDVVHEVVNGKAKETRVLTMVVCADGTLGCQTALSHPEFRAFGDGDEAATALWKTL